LKWPSGLWAQEINTLSQNNAVACNKTSFDQVAHPITVSMSVAIATANDQNNMPSTQEAILTAVAKSVATTNDQTNQALSIAPTYCRISVKMDSVGTVILDGNHLSYTNKILLFEHAPATANLLSYDKSKG
jgi:acid phosphatase family membrane protein YuiD